MAVYDVDIISPSGTSGDRVRVQAKNEDEARELALIDKDNWTATSITKF